MESENGRNLFVLKDLLDNLKETLKKSKGLMIQLTVKIADSGENWQMAQKSLEWAKYTDEILRYVNGKTTGTDTEFPYYSVDGDKLVKTGRGSKGGTYQHRVTKGHFTLICDKLIEKFGKNDVFETQRLVDACDIPKHEPSIVLNVLAKYGILKKERRGICRFENKDDFSSLARNVWNRLPRQNQN